MPRLRLSANAAAHKERQRRVNRIVADLNVLLAIFAIGLATLDLTFFVSEKIVDGLPQAVRVVSADVAPPPPAGFADTQSRLPP
jgi:hypothetical protein